jgi:hypothetical protein
MIDVVENSATNECEQIVVGIDVACATHLFNRGYSFGARKSFFNSSAPRRRVTPVEEGSIQEIVG